MTAKATAKEAFYVFCERYFLQRNILRNVLLGKGDGGNLFEKNNKANLAYRDLHAAREGGQGVG